MSAHARFTVDADVVPRFTACYLRVAGDECAFVEAHTAHALPRLLAALERHGKKPEDVRYLVLTHAHLDHASGASAVMAACPNATLLAHPRTAKHMIDPGKLVRGAKLVYGAARFTELYGEVTPIPAERVRGLEDGESFELGDARLTVWNTYGHAFHHFIVDDPKAETVFTGDTFGLVYPALQTHGRFAFPSTSPTGFDAVEANKSLDKVLSLGERFVCPTHFDAYDDVAEIGALVRRFIDRAGAWVEEASRGTDTQQAIEARFVELWWSAIADEAPRFGDAERQLLALDVDLNAQGLAHAACAIRDERAKPLA
jgi:glyoxylase-like metal-dependent hydrolase (beta-lactamase superfamily II)